MSHVIQMQHVQIPMEVLNVLVTLDTRATVSIAVVNLFIFSFSDIFIKISNLFIELNLIFFFQAEDGIRDQPRSRGLGDVYKRQRQQFQLQ